MSYLDIPQLYKAQEILAFKECYATEKIHGTSAHIGWKGGQLIFFAGGEKHDRFVALFDQATLMAKFTELGYADVTVYGEAYGGKCQGMSKTYGPDLRFVAFEVKVGDLWLNVPNAEQVARGLGFDFVSYRLIPTTMDAINAERDAPSVQAGKNGIVEEKMREGVVLRPPFEVRLNNGSRVIAKYKRDEFAETKTHHEVSAEKLAVLADARLIAEEWATEMRLTHVLDAFPDAGMEKTGDIIKAMWVDIEKESKGEIVTSLEARKAVSARTAQMFKARLQQGLKTL